MTDDDLTTWVTPIVRNAARRDRVPADVIADLTQEVLFKYLQRWGGSQAPDNPKAWVQTTTKNAITDYFRQQARRPADNFAPGADDPMSLLVATLRDLARTPSLVAVNEAICDEVFALAAPSDADLLRRRFLDGIPSADIAAEEGVSRNAIDKRVQRAKEVIAAALEQRPDLVSALATGHPHAYRSDHRFGR